VPPELLASPDAALRIIEAEMPKPINGNDVPIDIEEAPPVSSDDLELMEAEPVEADDPVRAPPAPAENKHRPSEKGGMSWADLIGGDLMVPSLFPWKPEPQAPPPPKPPDTLEVSDDIVEEATPEPIEEDVDLSDRPEDLMAELAARAREIAESHDVHLEPTEPGLIVDQSKFDTPEPVEPEELPDASFDAIPTDSAEDATQTEIPRAALMREVLLRFIERGSQDVGPQVILRLLAAIMEREGLLTEEKIEAALQAQED
jgi:hypothetical protein